MALTDKNIVITPNIGQIADPQIVFSGADTSTAARNITLKMYPTSSGTLSFEGSSGSLFSIVNTLSGSLFSVNDISGIPSIEVIDDGTVRLAQYAGNVLIGTSTTGSFKLDVSGNTRVAGSLTLTSSFTTIGQVSSLSIYAGSITSLTTISAGTQVSAATVYVATNVTSLGTINAATTVSSGTLYVGGAVTSLGTLAVAAGGNAILLNNGTTNRINWGTNGVAAPTTTNYSAGVKMVLYDSISAGSAGYTIGIESGTLFSTVDTTGNQFKWYGGTTLAATLTGTGGLTLVGGLTSTTVNAATQVSAASVYVATNVTSLGTINAATTVSSGTLYVGGAITSLTTINAATQVSSATLYVATNVTSLGTINAATQVSSATLYVATNVTSLGTINAATQVSSATAYHSGAVTSLGIIYGNQLNAATQVSAATVYAATNVTSLGTINAATQVSSGSLYIGTTSLLALNGGFVGINVAAASLIAPLQVSTLGSTYTVAPVNPLAILASSVDNYNQFIIQNRSTGTNASNDFIVSNDQGSDTTNFGDFGINGSNYGVGGVFGDAGGVYLYAQSNTLTLGTAGASALKFATNSTEYMRIDSTGKVAIGTSTATVALTIRATDAVQLPAGTTAQQPAGTSGMIRYNTSTNGFEGHSAGAWSAIGGGAGGATVSSSPTIGASNGALWFNTNSSYTAIYIAATSSWMNINRTDGYVFTDLDGGTTSTTGWSYLYIDAGGVS